MYRDLLSDYIPEFIDAFVKQLVSDQKRWGDTWKDRGIGDYKHLGVQEERAYSRFNDYFEQWKNTNTPIPWLKIIGEAFICWVRESVDNGEFE